MSKIKLFFWSSPPGLGSSLNKINPGPLWCHSRFMKRNLCVSVKCAGVCHIGSEETNGLIFSAGFWSVQQGYTQCRYGVQLGGNIFRGLPSVPHSLCALSCETCKNNNICSLIIKDFIIMHEHRGGKWRFVHVQLLNNFLNYSILLKQQRFRLI